MPGFFGDDPFAGITSPLQAALDNLNRGLFPAGRSDAARLFGGAATLPNGAPTPTGLPGPNETWQQKADRLFAKPAAPGAPANPAAAANETWQQKADRRFGRTAAPATTPTPAGATAPVGNGPYDSAFSDVASRYAAEAGMSVDEYEDLLHSIAGTENSGADATSGAGAHGIMQVLQTPDHQQFWSGLDPNNPAHQIEAGARVVNEKRKIIKQYGFDPTPGNTGAAYYGGFDWGTGQPNSATDGSSVTGIEYANRVNNTYNQRRQQRTSLTGRLTDAPDQMDPTLTAEEAANACGPAAYIAFAHAYGRNPTMREAVTLAAQNGWDTNGGMNGAANYSRMLTASGLPNDYTLAPDWGEIDRRVQQGKPVTISTPFHYFHIGGRDQAGRYYVGTSGRRAYGGEWMTPDELEAYGRGAINGVFMGK